MTLALMSLSSATNILNVRCDESDELESEKIENLIHILFGVTKKYKEKTY